MASACSHPLGFTRYTMGVLLCPDCKTSEATERQQLIEEGIKVIQSWYAARGNHAIAAVISAAREVR